MSESADQPPGESEASAADIKEDPPAESEDDKNLEKLLEKPSTMKYTEKEGEELVVTPDPPDTVLISNCKECKFTIQRRAAKCVIDSCSSVQIELEDALMSGSMELKDCKDVTLRVNPQEPLQTLTAERCEGLDLYFHEPRALGSIYTVQCPKMTVHFQPPHTETNEVELQCDENQYVTRYADGKLTTAKVVKDKSDKPAEPEKPSDEEKEQQVRKMLESYLRNLITFAEQKEAEDIASGKKKPEEEEEKKKKKKKKKKKDKKEGEGEEAGESVEKKEGKEGAEKKEAEEGAEKMEGEEVEEEGGSEYESGDSDSSVDEKKLEEILNALFSSNIKNKDDKKEFFDSEEEFAKKMDQVAEWMQSSKYVIAFTGAGISTSSGIPDYRSGMDTVLDTGPGVWELAAHKKSRPAGTSVTPIINALPSLTHMAIVQMQWERRIRHTVSQNIDGLHRRSGLRPNHLSELHGNTNLEKCEKCDKQYLRDFKTREAELPFDHTTSRHCVVPGCGGKLLDSIINFGEPLPNAEINMAMLHASVMADMCLVLGSSLRVSPANQVPLVVKQKGGKVVICNLQKITDYPEDENTIHVFAKCDDFMEALCKRLDITIPPFRLKRRAKVETKQDESGKVIVTVTGLDVDEDLPYSFIKTAATRVGEESFETSTEPMILTLPASVADNLPPITIQCHGHYGEPTFELPCPPLGTEQIYRMSYEVLARDDWVVKREKTWDEIKQEIEEEEAREKLEQEKKEKEAKEEGTKDEAQGETKEETMEKSKDEAQGETKEESMETTNEGDKEATKEE